MSIARRLVSSPLVLRLALPRNPVAVSDYAQFAAYEILTAARDSVDDALTAALSPLTGVRALSPFDPLPPPALLARTASAALGCARPADDSLRFYFRVDLRDGASDGCPPLPSREARRQWLAVLEAQYAQFREQVIKAERFGEPPPWLDDYGATAIDEFFAVACEAYFVNRERFTREFPQLTVLFDGFYLPPN